MSLPPVISQRGYPGAGDIDDCWVVATVWAAVAYQRDIRQPTVTEYRRHAGDPDDGFRDGGSLDEVIAGARGSWPGVQVSRVDTTNWLLFAGPVKRGQPASLAVDSATLPSGLRFGFNGKHQIGVGWDGGFKVANPLAPDGSKPLPITESALKRAALALIPQMQVVRAAVFPIPLPDTSTEDVMYSIQGVDGPFPATLKPRTTIYDAPTGSVIRQVFDNPAQPFTVVAAGADGNRWAIYGRTTTATKLGWVAKEQVVR